MTQHRYGGNMELLWQATSILLVKHFMLITSVHQRLNIYLIKQFLEVYVRTLSGTKQPPKPPIGMSSAMC